MKNTIKISSALSLPLDVVTQTIAILAKRRAGKSYAMRRIVEQLFVAGQQIILVDPKGDQWGIRSSADGKGKGLPIIILGGEHGDVPLEANAGEIVAKLVVEDGVSTVLDISSFRKNEVAVFMTGFLENLYRLKAQEKYRTPMMLVIDEADAIAPQKPYKGEERMLGAAEDIVRRGGQRGIGCILVTQRSAVLNKNVLTQAQVLVALRTIAPQDLAAMNSWIDVHGTQEERKTLMESLPSLPTGDAWFWSPGWPTEEGIFRRVHVLPIETFDSGATPKPGEMRKEPKTMADVDLEALKRQMSSTIEKIKSDDPKALRRRISELEREKETILKTQPKQNPVKIERINVPTIGKRTLEGMKESERKMRKLAKVINEAVTVINAGIEKFSSEIIKAERLSMPQKPIIDRPEANRRVSVPVISLPKNDGEKTIGSGERAILTAIAQFPEGITNEHIAVLTGYKATSRRTYLQLLSQKGYVRRSGNNFAITKEGINELGSDFVPLPTGPDLQEHLKRTLPAGEARIFKVILEAYPESVSRENIMDSTGYKQTSIRTYLQNLNARKVIEVENGEIRASEKLF